MKQCCVDFETFSDVDIKKSGLYKYIESPAFDILLIAWTVNDEPVQLIDLTQDEDPEPFLQVVYDKDVELRSYNAAFEHATLNTWLERRNLPTLPLHCWHCTMAHGLYCGYTAGLGITGEAMGLPQDKRKLAVGAALIRRFCVPQKEKAKPLIDGLMGEETSLAKVRRVIAMEPEKWNLFKEYCRQDVETEREIERRLRKWPMPAKEQIVWELTCEANAGGVGVDTDLVDSAIAIGEAEQARMMKEAREISGLDNPKSVQQLMTWLNKEMDEEISDLRKTTVAGLLEAGVDSSKAARMLELRQQMSKTSTKKYDALRAAVCRDGRVRGMLFYYGAKTGRWAGRIVQPQNLPQNHLPNLDYARQLAKAGDTELLTLSYGSVPDTLSQLIRTAFIPRRGMRFAVADYSAIEARVVAWLAGEQWVLDAFREGKDIYCATASQMFGVPVEKHGQNSELRQRGKVAVLALGYGGGESALEAMGALRMGIPEEDLPGIKASWRKANPSICALWRRVEDAAVGAVLTAQPQVVQIKVKDPDRARENEARTGAAAGSYSEYFKTSAKLTFRREGDAGSEQDFLTIELPSRRKLFYAKPFLAPAKNFPDRQSLHYWGVNQTSKKWSTMDTWGGKLVENITQAVARDCLAETLIILSHKRMNPVFHVHDEVIVEVNGEDDLQTILDVMAAPIDWAPGLPLKGAGFTCDYYQKD